MLARQVVDDIADADRELADAVADGEVPPDMLEQPSPSTAAAPSTQLSAAPSACMQVPPVVLEQALAAARVAGRACRNGLDDAGFGKHNSSYASLSAASKANHLRSHQVMQSAVIRLRTAPSCVRCPPIRRLKQHLRNRGFDEDLVDAAAKKAIDLHNMGYSPGAAFAGGIAYAEARRDGCSAYCADKAALAAARAAEEIGKTDRTVRAALARNDIPADVLALAVAAGREAAKRCMSGRDRFGPGGESDVGRKAADFLRRRGFPTDLQVRDFEDCHQLCCEAHPDCLVTASCSPPVRLMMSTCLSSACFSMHRLLAASRCLLIASSLPRRRTRSERRTTRRNSC